LENGNYQFKFKDDATVGEDGKFDPGGNKVGVNIKGMGSSNLRLTDLFFKKIKEAGIFTQYISSDIENNTMTVLPAIFFGEGIEVICRFKAVGSFIRRFGKYAKDGQDLPAFVEITLKDDDRGDPPITKEGLEVLGILKEGEYDELVSLTRKICLLIKDELAEKGLELYDIKLEFGRCEGKIALIDEISSGSMRAYKDGKSVAPLELVQLILS
jgi:phosphoribosylaminoimidazole-succinocarboxamide synthase